MFVCERDCESHYSAKFFCKKVLHRGMKTGPRIGATQIILNIKMCNCAVPAKEVGITCYCITIASLSS